MDYENQLYGKGWIGDGCRLCSWGLIGVLPVDFHNLAKIMKILQNAWKNTNQSPTTKSATISNPTLPIKLIFIIHKYSPPAQTNTNF